MHIWLWTCFNRVAVTRVCCAAGGELSGPVAPETTSKSTGRAGKCLTSRAPPIRVRNLTRTLPLTFFRQANQFEPGLEPEQDVQLTSNDRRGRPAQTDVLHSKVSPLRIEN